MSGGEPLDAVHRILLSSGEIKYIHEKGESNLIQKRNPSDSGVPHKISPRKGRSSGSCLSEISSLNQLSKISP
ncbi:hypothetical protein [Algoriphagus boritolerans]|uniref:hypothetical protein n=1 Tax=Algoriphagus boritolerans TaxID=308111 RepID=UPI003A0FB921